MTRTISYLLGIFLMSLNVGCAVNALPAAPVNPEPYSFQTTAGTKIHVLQTGWVSVKQRFRELRGPDSLRLPSIIVNRKWTEWIPIQFYVIEHKEGVIVFDTGETADAMHPEHFNCDPITNWFYLNQLRFSVNHEHELGPQLEKIGLAPANVKWVVLSHLHSDHIGGLKYLNKSKVFISKVDAQGHAGALMCRMPKHLNTTLVSYPDGPFGAFTDSYKVTSDGNVRIVPTPGHTAGHQSLLYKQGNKYMLFAGDVIFDQLRLDAGKGLAGIVESVKSARQSISRVSEQMMQFDTVLAPAHDARVRPSHTHSQ